MRTHEDYIRDVAAFAVMHADLNPSEHDSLAGIKLVYGASESGVRGITYYNRWQDSDKQVQRPFVQVSAFAQESIEQLTGTTLHELGHVLAGFLAGHGKDWHLACDRLGLIDVKAAGTEYCWDNFKPWIRDYAKGLEAPNEGSPVKMLVPNVAGLPMSFKLRGCPAGIGTRGGKSRGVGSGSRLRLFECDCAKPVKVRLACDEFDAMHNPCGSLFHKV